ncbi:hypothetical protein ACT3UM_20975 [Halomonas sp. AOP13-D3-9]
MALPISFYWLFYQLDYQTENSAGHLLLSKRRANLKNKQLTDLIDKKSKHKIMQVYGKQIIIGHRHFDDLIHQRVRMLAQAW